MSDATTPRAATKSLRDSPSLSSLKYEAKQILKRHKAGDAMACTTLQQHPRFTGKTSEQMLAESVTLQEVQHALALQYGFTNWSSLTETVLGSDLTGSIQIADTRINLLSPGEVDPSAASASVLGIDIGSSSIKLVELSQQGQTLRLECYGIEPLPQSAVVDKNIVDPDIVSAALERLTRRCNPGTVDAALAVAGSAVLTKTIEMPVGLTDDALENAIRENADEYLPYPLHKTALAFEVKRRSPGNDSMMEVLLTACVRDHVSMRHMVLERAALNARVIDLEVYCIERACRTMMDNIDFSTGEIIAVFSIGATMSSLTVMTNEFSPPYIRIQSFGGLQLTQEIQRRYDMSFEQAEAAKRTGGLPDDYENQVHQPWIHAIIENVSNGLKFFSGQGHYDSVDRIILGGGVAATNGLAEVATSKTGIPTTIADPFAIMELSSRVDAEKLVVDAPAMMLACGLALRGVTSQRADAIATGRHRTVWLPEEPEE